MSNLKSIFLSLFAISTIFICTPVEAKQERVKCMKISKFKVIQVLDSEKNIALATECKNDEEAYCSGIVALLTPQEDVDYYDDMMVELPPKMCAVQAGVYTYETLAQRQKTVPIVVWKDRTTR